MTIGHDHLGVKLMSLNEFIYKEHLPFYPKDKNKFLEAVGKRPEYQSLLRRLNATQIEAFDLIDAFTHKSFSNEVKFEIANNEKLEFLGDAVLELCISELLYKRFPLLNEGLLSKLRSAVVNEATLYQLAKHLMLSDLLILGKGEFKASGHLKPSILSDALEALLGLLYQKEGYQFTYLFVENLYNELKNLGHDFINVDVLKSFDSKSRLQEKIVEVYKELPRYEVEFVKNNQFQIALYIKDKKIISRSGPSKKKVIQSIAKETLDNKLYQL
jgi:ribonuclease-3